MATMAVRVALIFAALWPWCVLRAQEPAAPVPNPPDQGRAGILIEVAGDVLPESTWRGIGDAQHLFDGVREEFARADLVFVNLEEPVTRSTRVTPYKNRAAVSQGLDYILRARDPAIPAFLKEAGIGLVGLANNHMMDYTETGLSDTIDAFGKAGLPVVGAGLKPAAERAYVFEKQGRRVALLAFSDVVPTRYEATPARLGVASSKRAEDLVEAIHRARAEADFVVLMIHWGGQGSHAVTARQRQLARIAAQAGCDVVVGMHPHVLQGAEYFHGVPVLYSVGNFAFPSSNPAARQCVIARLAFDASRLSKVETVPVEISPAGAPAIPGDWRGERILASLDSYCRPFNAGIAAGTLVPSPQRERADVNQAKGRGRRSGRSRRKAAGGGQAAVSGALGSDPGR